MHHYYIPEKMFVYAHPKLTKFKWSNRGKPTLNELCRYFSDFQWPAGYGGSLWGDIARGAQKLGDAQTLNDKAVWIDHCVDLEHNNDCVFDKDSQLESIVRAIIAIKSSFNNVIEYYNFVAPYASSEVKSIYKEYFRYFKRDIGEVRYFEKKELVLRIMGYDMGICIEESEWQEYCEDIETLCKRNKSKARNAKYNKKINLKDLIDFYLCFYLQHYVNLYATETYEIEYFNSIFEERANLIKDVFYEYLYRACLNEAAHEKEVPAFEFDVKSVYGLRDYLYEEEAIAIKQAEQDLENYKKKEAKKKKKDQNFYPYSWHDFCQFNIDGCVNEYFKKVSLKERGNMIFPFDLQCFIENNCKVGEISTDFGGW